MTTPIWGGDISTKGRKINLELTRYVCGTGQNPSLWTRAPGQMPNANRFCHQDVEGLDTDQLPLPRDRLLERRWALSKIDDRCQKVISPQRDAGPQRSSNPRQRCLLGQAAGQAAGRAARQAARRAALT